MTIRYALSNVLRPLTLLALACLAAFVCPFAAASNGAAGDAKPAAAQSTKAHNFAPDLTEPFEAVFELSIRSRERLSLMGSDETTGAEMDATIRIELVEPAQTPRDAAQGSTRATLVFDRIAVRFEGEGILTGSFDSRTPAAQDDPDDPLALAVRPIVGKELLLAIAPDGTIETVAGLNRLAPEGTAGFVFTRLFNDDALRSMVQPVFRVRPLGEDESLDAPRQGRPAIRQRVGSTWEIRDEGVSPLGLPPAELELTFESVSREGNDERALLSVQGQPEAQLPERAQSLPTKDVSRTVEGEAVWSLTQGLLHSLGTTSKTIFQTEGAFKIDISIEATTELDRVK